MKKAKRKSTVDTSASVRSTMTNTGGGSSYLKIPTGFEVYKPKKGTTTNNHIIPYKISSSNNPALSDRVKIGDFIHGRIIKVHFGIGVNNTAIACPRNINKPCPICEKNKALQSDPNFQENEDSPLPYPRTRFVYNWREEGSSKKYILEMSPGNFENPLKEEVEANKAWGFANFVNGKTIKVRWKEDTMKTNKYVKAGRIDLIDREEDYDIDEPVADLDNILSILSYEKIESIFYGEDMPVTEPSSSEHHEAMDEEEEMDGKEDDQFTSMTRKELKQFIKQNDLLIKVFKKHTEDDIRDLIREQWEGEEEEEEEEEEENGQDDYDDMDRSELKRFIKAYPLSIRVTKSMTDDDIRQAIRKGLAENEDEEEDVDENSGSGECPAGGHFGTDVDTLAECEDCAVYVQCSKASSEDLPF